MNPAATLLVLLVFYFIKERTALTSAIFDFDMISAGLEIDKEILLLTTLLKVLYK